MKKLLIILCFVCGLVGLVPALAGNASAQTGKNPFQVACDQIPPGQPRPSSCSETGKDPLSGADGEGLLIKITRLVALVTGIAAVIAIIIGGIEYVMSTGDSAKLNTAKNTIIFAAAGLIIAGAAQALVTFVLSQL